MYTFIKPLGLVRPNYTKDYWASREEATMLDLQRKLDTCDDYQMREVIAKQIAKPRNAWST